MPLPFRQRIFLILAALTAAPTALAVVGWALAVRTVAPSAGARVALEEVAASARAMVERMDTVRLAPRERAALREHLERLSASVTLARRTCACTRAGSRSWWWCSGGSWWSPHCGSPGTCRGSCRGRLTSWWGGRG